MKVWNNANISKNRRKIAVKPNGVTMGKAWSRSEIGDSHEKLVVSDG